MHVGVCVCVRVCVCPSPERYREAIHSTAASEKRPQTQKASWTVLRPLLYGADPRHEVISLGLAAFVLQRDWQEGWLSETIEGSVTAIDGIQDVAIKKI